MTEHDNVETLDFASMAHVLHFAACLALAFGCGLILGCGIGWSAIQ